MLKFAFMRLREAVMKWTPCMWSSTAEIKFANRWHRNEMRRNYVMVVVLLPRVHQCHLYGKWRWPALLQSVTILSARTAMLLSQIVGCRWTNDNVSLVLFLARCHENFLHLVLATSNNFVPIAFCRVRSLFGNGLPIFLLLLRTFCFLFHSYWLRVNSWFQVIRFILSLFEWPYVKMPL